MSAKQLRIRATPNHVMVERRSPWTPVITFIGTFVFSGAFMLIMPGKHNNPSLLQIMLRSGHIADLSIFVFIAIFSAFMSYGSLKLSRAEFVHCDDTKFHHARKGIGRAWIRTSYPREAIKRLRWDIFAFDRNTKVSSLMFEANGVTGHALEGLTLIEADRILASCQGFGYDVFRDETVPMLLDIEKRGWFVNPWRPDEVETHPKEQQ
ncbi:hypothetical protein [Terriglobus sp. RCC_193]|uniref:hypothetical protein n=1 Tax=Terriglobus sp. RCC_193 TaxID=3239218 RepID=UPI0035269780